MFGLYCSKSLAHENECVSLFVYFFTTRLGKQAPFSRQNLLFKQMFYTGTKNRMHKIFNFFPHFEHESTEIQKKNLPM